MAILSSFSVKDIIELMKKGGSIEAHEKIMELRQAAVALQEENIALRRQVHELHEQLDLQKRLHFDGCVYWLNDNTPEQEGPFCQRCRDVDAKMVRLQYMESQHDGRIWFCHGCKQNFGSSPK